MKLFVAVAVASLAASVSAQAPAAGAPAAAGGVPQINWGNCPQLEPSEKDKMAKAKVLEACLKDHPAPKPEDLTEEVFFAHQGAIASCALKKEEWFNKDGTYKFKKAEDEIKKKKLTKAMEKKLLEAHEKCRNESKAFKKPDGKTLEGVEQVQFYQACMDTSISGACNIQIVGGPAPPK